MMKSKIVSLLMLTVLPCTGEAALKALIVDGQNNHVVWPKSTIMMKQCLEETGLFEVDIQRTRYTWKTQREAAFLPLAGVGETEDRKDPTPDPDFAPAFKDYDVVISNFGWKAADWPEATQRALEAYISNGGGLVAVHAANNAWPTWKEFNRMIGLGGWGGRTEKDGPYVYYTNDGELVRDPSPGSCGAHGPRHEFPVTVRVPDHPITEGMPRQWLTTKDECYAKLRGPAENMTVLATGKDQTEKAPTDRHEPILMTIEYGTGRCFHTTLGHDDYSIESVGFITSFTRGVEWAATGKVTQPMPDDFPTATDATRRAFVLKTDAASSDWTPLLDPDLSAWEVWTGVPHTTVQDLPEGVAGSDDVTKGTPIGLGDPKKIFTVQPDPDGTPILHITGEVYAGLTTLNTYSNYHFTMQVKWGEKKWEPRLERKRDSGLLYHCYGKHGAFWQVWKRCLELQIEESNFGDLYCLGGTRASVSIKDSSRWDAGQAKKVKRAKRSVNAESPHGEWTRIDLYVLDDQAIHVVNGTVVLTLRDATTHDGQKLTSGQIQIQSEAAVCFARDLRIRPIAAFPPDIRTTAGL